MDEFLSFNKFLIFLIDFLACWFALRVYFADRKAKLNRLFFLLTISILIWVNAGYFLNFSEEYDKALLWAKIAPAGVFIFFVSFYFFSVYFPREQKRIPFLEKAILFGGLFSAFITLFTNLIIRGVEFTQWGVNPIFSQIGRVFFYGTVIFLTLLIISQLLIKYSRVSIRERLKVQYLLAGIIIFVLMNIIFNVFLPIYQGTIKYWQFGNYSIIFLLGLTAYAIVARELFGMRVILTQVLVVIIAILLLAQAITSVSWFGFTWKFVLFLIFVYFGYLLIQSVIREIQRRAELQRLYDELEKLDEAKTEFMSIVSHQLRTPLTAIKGYTSMILEGIYGKFSEKMQKPLSNTLLSSERLIKFVNDILNVTRIEAGRIYFTPEITSLEEVISSVVFELDIKAKEKNLYLKWDPPPKFGGGPTTQAKEPLPKIMIDKDKIRQVVLNLIDNAIKYTNKGGVTVKSEVRSTKIVISVSDTGTGMSKEDIQKLFKSFSRGESGVTYYKEGTGLGLYIGRKFVEMQGGRVWAESPGKGKGSTFYIELPAK